MNMLRVYLETNNKRGITIMRHTNLQWKKAFRKEFKNLLIRVGYPRILSVAMAKYEQEAHCESYPSREYRIDTPKDAAQECFSYYGD